MDFWNIALLFLFFIIVQMISSVILMYINGYITRRQREQMIGNVISVIAQNLMVFKEKTGNRGENDV